MTIQQLRYISALNTHRNFVKAADACSVSQPTLTMQLKKLENEMGLTIFDRSKQPLTPTPTGVEVIQRANEILHNTEQLFEFIRGQHESISGQFKLGIIPTLAPYLLPKFLPSFLNENELVEPTIEELQTQTIINRLKEGSLDVGLLATPLNEPGIREIKLFYEPFYLYGEAAKVRTMDDASNLPDEELLLLEEGHCFRSQTLEVCKQTANDKQQFHYRSGSIESLKSLVQQGLGYTLVPAMSVTDFDKPYLAFFKAPQPAREISLVVHSSFVKEKLLETLRENIIRNVPEEFQAVENYSNVRWRQL
ncbi:MAG: hydrogen peroxide-inducible genes activator [Flavobacteriales bacterium]|nr:hydrogen peroxide-inducible genes activator [Flavobacteriales bacterium]MDG1779956.1 hydrogen peroxide-inducible genes activator [Flavobacteriales bacterium]MDG2245726.1 hydrogen peroxide-inducible genes activator [Flavobacteriales bacterium]